jgi:hypothetical protein
MTPEEEDYQKAIRRIQEAEKTGAVELNLIIESTSSWVERLKSLQSLNLYGCHQLSGDLSPLTALTSLQELSLSECLGVHRFAPLESLLPTLFGYILSSTTFGYSSSNNCHFCPNQDILSFREANL